MKKIFLANGKGVSLVGDDVYKWASKIKWHLGNKGYARHTCHILIDGKRKSTPTYLHKLVIDCPVGMMRDHINGNRLDNRRSNLRICTNSENVKNRKKHKNNTSGYKGVFREKSAWISKIGVNTKRIYVGYFKTAKDAAHAYDEAAKKYHGDFAKLNFPDSTDG